MDNQGWIKLHRKTLDNPIICKDADHFAVWHYLLLSAAHKEYKTLLGGKKITLKPGQLITGREILSKQLNISESKINRILNCFESERMIEQMTHPRVGRIITISHWNEYQSSEQLNERLVNDYRTNSERLVNGIQEYKNTKNINNINNIYTPKGVGENPLEKIYIAWNSLPEPISKLKEIKPNSIRGRNLNVRLVEYGEDEILKAIESIKQSPFLLGRNDRAWIIDFEWFVKPNNFIKVLEGRYLDSNKKNNNNFASAKPVQGNRDMKEIKASQHHITNAYVERKIREKAPWIKRLEENKGE